MELDSHIPSSHLVIDGFWPGVTQRSNPSGPAQCETCEYAGFICIVVVIVVVPKASVIAAKAIVIRFTHARY
jgi:hypothetical protein